MYMVSWAVAVLWRCKHASRAVLRQRLLTEALLCQGIHLHAYTSQLQVK